MHIGLISIAVVAARFFYTSLTTKFNNYNVCYYKYIIDANKRDEPCYMCIYKKLSLLAVGWIWVAMCFCVIRQNCYTFFKMYV